MFRGPSVLYHDNPGQLKKNSDLSWLSYTFWRVLHFFLRISHLFLMGFSTWCKTNYQKKITCTVILLIFPTLVINRFRRSHRQNSGNEGRFGFIALICATVRQPKPIPIVSPTFLLVSSCSETGIILIKRHSRREYFPNRYMHLLDWFLDFEIQYFDSRLILRICCPEWFPWAIRLEH